MNIEAGIAPVSFFNLIYSKAIMHRAGWTFVSISAVFTAIFISLGWPFLASIGVILVLFFVYFFRNPDRIPPLSPGSIVSPADGQVVFIGQAKAPFLEKEMKKISIFMSIFDVHVNRMPFDAKVEKIKYKKGRFIPAYKAEADSINEANVILCSTQRGNPFIIVQIAGILARRIICDLKPGQEVKKGERIGIICFGSKVDLYLPENTTILPLLGKKVKAGETILGYWP